ncbi:metallophosphoesterase [Alkalibacillus haloalkaliphilus]|uniref:Metallophosphoesterase n=1 Tax=Alkalibacillus haloalkaliphilus TaxID=94136 RepID=A0A511W2L7_9BACI|nr:metallophosphoesterase [Alkalibacillus haloalkaliphilus]GEN45325.1 metallophosphoesterase [Alkalibacillus haloalkaliphilus]
MTRFMTRRSFLKRATIGTLGTVATVYGGYYYAHDVEPFWLKVQNNDVRSHRIPSSFNNFKIVQFTDTHIGFQYRNKDLKKLVNAIQNQQPDLIVFTGDLTDDPSLISSDKYREIIDQLSRLEAPFGKFWIYGNHDHGGYGTTTILNVMNDSGFKLLKNDTEQIEIENDYINLSGLDDILLGNPRPDQLINDENEGSFNVLLCHEPDYADDIVHLPFDLQLSGHSHGGQVQIPFYGYVVTPALGQKYVEGKHTLGDRLQLFTSRGVGTTRLPFRFLCRPEINVYNLKQA